MIKSVHYLHKPTNDIIKGKYPWDGVINRFFKCSPMIWEDLGEDLFTELFGNRERQLGGKSDVLLSDENACNPRDPVRLHAHLKALRDLSQKWGFERMRVFCSVRQQATRMASGYAQVSDRRLGASQQGFEDRVFAKIHDHYYKDGIKYDYALLRKAFVDTVGKDNFLLLPYESMKENLSDFLSRWFKFLDRSQEGKEIIARVTNNPKVKAKNQRSLSRHVWKIRDRTKRGATLFRLRPGRVFSKLGLPTTVAIRWPDLKREKEIRLTPDIENQIMAVYRDSNMRLAKAIGEDLGRYNYYY